MKQFKTAFASILCLLFYTQMAVAFDVSKMTGDQRAAFRAEIRAYLLDNPEVIYEAVDILQQKQAQTETQRDLELVRNNSALLFLTSSRSRWVSVWACFCCKISTAS